MYKKNISLWFHLKLLIFDRRTLCAWLQTLANTRKRRRAPATFQRDTQKSNSSKLSSRLVKIVLNLTTFGLILNRFRNPMDYQFTWKAALPIKSSTESQSLFALSVLHGRERRSTCSRTHQSWNRSKLWIILN